MQIVAQTENFLCGILQKYCKYCKCELYQSYVNFRDMKTVDINNIKALVYD